MARVFLKIIFRGCPIIHSLNGAMLERVVNEAYSGTLTRREIVRANASLGELRRDKEKLSSTISCEFVRVKAS